MDKRKQMDRRSQNNIRTFAPLDVGTEEELLGLDISGVFAHYNKCINEGNVPASSQSNEYRRARRAFLIGYDRSVPRLRQASHCIGCNQCVHHCPQNIDIPAEMQRIDTFVEQLKQNPA